MCPKINNKKQMTKKCMQNIICTPVPIEGTKNYPFNEPNISRVPVDLAVTKTG